MRLLRRLCAPLLLLSSACTLRVPVAAPTASTVRYDSAASAGPMALADQRPRHEEFSRGRVKVAVEFEGGGSELDYVARNVNRALVERGVSPGDASAALSARVRAFYVRNRRVSGFSPFVTFTHFSADVTQGARTVRVAVYGKHGKVPVWRMGEVNVPCYQRPLTRLTGELAAKLNRHFAGGQAPAADVASRAAKLSSLTGAELLAAISELGWSNHPDALAPLLALTAHADEEVRAAALAGVGTLGLADSFGPLQRIYQGEGTHTDRFAALAAIGDLATPEALEFLARVQASPGDDADEILAITRLFLADRPASEPSAVAGR